VATAASAAKHIFISTSRFRDLVANGTITHQKPGEYRLETVRREYITNAQRVMQRRGENGGKALSEQRARLADVQAQRAEFLLLKDQGQFVELTLMQTMLTRAFGVFRERTNAVSFPCQPIRCLAFALWGPASTVRC
jgi:hypothetical protein